MYCHAFFNFLQVSIGERKILLNSLHHQTVESDGRGILAMGVLARALFIRGSRTVTPYTSAAQTAQPLRYSLQRFESKLSSPNPFLGS